MSYYSNTRWRVSGCECEYLVNTIAETPVSCPHNSCMEFTRAEEGPIPMFLSGYFCARCLCPTYIFEEGIEGMMCYCYNFGVN